MNAKGMNENNSSQSSIRKHKIYKIIWLPKLIYVLLASVGITISKKKCPVYASVCIYHAVRIIHVFRSAMCMKLRNKATMDYSILASDIVLITLWWSLFFKRNKLYNFIVSLSKRYSSFQVHPKKAILCAIFSLTMCPIITDMVRKLSVGEYYYVTNSTTTCMNYLVPQSFKHFSATVFVIDISVFHTYISVFYIATFLYCCTGLLILHNFSRTSHGLLEAWSNCRNMVNSMKKFERIYALPVFLLFSQIAFNTCILVLMYAENSIPSFRIVHFSVTASQMATWVICVVFIAETAQKRCGWIVNLVSRNMDALKGTGISINSFDCKKMIADSTLTAWGMCVLNRSVLLTAFASLVTYSVIILDQKKKY